MTLYRDVLKRAWGLSWHTKSLWLFGFLATFWGIGNVYGALIQGLRLAIGRDFYIVNLWRDIADAGMTWSTFGQAITGAPVQAVIFLVILAALLAIILFFYWVFTCSQVTVIRQVAAIEQATSRNVFTALYQSRHFFWPVFWVNVFGRLAILAILLILSYGGIANALSDSVTMVGFVGYLALFLVSVILILVVSFLVVFSVIYITVKNYSMTAAIRAAGQLFSRHWLVALETAAVLLGVSVLAAMALILIAILLLGPFYLMVFIAVLLSSPLIYLIMFFGIIAVFVIVAVLVTAWLTTFHLATWVELFNRMEAGSVESKLHRLAQAKLGIN
ncbi:MAG: hypothetical protein AAB817_00315 [Patescibacteria group bacterium]